jgi:hypothetical protein
MNNFAEIPNKTKTLFTFHRVNYKPDKVLYYDVILNSSCEFTEEVLDPYYFKPKVNQRIELNDDSYFVPKNVEHISSNHIKFSFRALDKLIGEDGIIDAYIFPNNTPTQNSNLCNEVAIVNFEGNDYKIDSIFAKMRVILGKPLGLKNSYALLRPVEMTTNPEMPFVVSKEVKKVCLYGDCE